ncbi:UDP-Gal:alpha-D-GlcNAc-diphosphoundecaprenol beta-1,4-galactosyltransferase [Caballeronia calidae]|uniref:UDP-Gal:alpha-D-GlcNAc-diphosphoundecaprenol beta-1,4-galactosyltransferase n=1 Tax=Caballeronia calidae TaxID=1777139 RepID=A0A158C1A0_9BURK|nr:WecB/TagA/CpsF family glycosyltransferase [Caballeronia calidae]SAK75317.1 UDP-Gal:alpha-D-GlcNAc-diphosphoundecaprenol beta-1,4-galactosyltransferase [Caballeronia calidae]
MHLNALRRNSRKIAEGPSDVLSARLCTFLNPYSYFLLRSHGSVLEKFDVIGVDGFSLCVILRWMGVCNTPRLSFDMTSIARDVLRHAERKGKSVFLVGTTRDHLDVATKSILERFPQLKFCGTHHGYFNQEEEQSLIDSIIKTRADIVICGMGAIKQERFLAALAGRGWDGQGYSCGGFIHQIAKGGLEYYPSWINRWNLRWLFRIFDEPRLLKRYFLLYPIAMLILMKDAAGLRVSRRSENS